MDNTYTISKATIQYVLEVLHDNWFSYGLKPDENPNNDDIIDATKRLEKEIEKFEHTP